MMDKKNFEIEIACIGRAIITAYTVTSLVTSHS